MNTTPKFHPTLWGTMQSCMNIPAWTVSSEAWKEGRYLDSFFALLDYINPSIRKMYGNAEQNKFQIPHGSVIVNISINHDSILITSDFVNISGAQRVPLLRKAAELNFHPLNLAQIRMSGDNLCFTYNSTLDTSEPYKMFFVLREICKTADRYDDDFREKFQSKNLVEPEVVYCTDKEAEQAVAITREIVNDTLAFATYFDSLRAYNQTLDILNIGLKRIDFAVQPKGFLKNEIERVQNDMAKTETSVVDRNNYARALLVKILQMQKEDVVKSLYKTQVFVPDKQNASVDGVRHFLNPYATNAQKYLSDRHDLMAVLECLFGFYTLLYGHYVDKQVSDEITDAMASASQKSWTEAASILVPVIVKYKNVSHQ